MNGNYLKTRTYEDKNVRAVGAPVPCHPLKTTKTFLRSYLLILLFSYGLSTTCIALTVQKPTHKALTRVGDRRTHTPPGIGGFAGVFVAVAALPHIPNHIRQDR
jgi:hypothetical protein